MTCGTRVLATALLWVQGGVSLTQHYHGKVSITFSLFSHLFHVSLSAGVMLTVTRVYPEMACLLNILAFALLHL